MLIFPDHPTAASSEPLTGAGVSNVIAFVGAAASAFNFGGSATTVFSNHSFRTFNLSHHPNDVAYGGIVGHFPIFGPIFGPVLGTVFGAIFSAIVGTIVGTIVGQLTTYGSVVSQLTVFGYVSATESGNLWSDDGFTFHPCPALHRGLSAPSDIQSPFHLPASSDIQP